MTSSQIPFPNGLHIPPLSVWYDVPWNLPIAQILSLHCILRTKVASAQNTRWEISFSGRHSHSIQVNAGVDYGQRADMALGQWHQLLATKKTEGEEERSVAHSK